jgi:HSP20 family protein
MTPHGVDYRHVTVGKRVAVSVEWRVCVMKMTRWDPLRELEEASARLNRFFGQSAGRPLGDDGGEMLADWAPAIDVQETEGEYLIKADLPAVNKEDVKVSVQDGILAVEGERRQEKEEKGRKFHRIERSYGRFVRRLALPTDVDQPKMAAEFKDGVLSVHLPKSAAAKPRTIDVAVS